MILKSQSDYQKEVKLASYLYQENCYYEKGVWRLLLQQYVEEKGKYPIEFDKNGQATELSLKKFLEIMEKFTERIVPITEVLQVKNLVSVIHLTLKTGFVQTEIWVRAI